MQLHVSESKFWHASWIILPASKKAYTPTPMENGRVKALPLAEVPTSPAYRIRRDLDIHKSVRKGTLYATAHGVYQLKLDGKRIGQDELAPGHTRYASRLLVQKYDVTDMLSEGAHTLAGIIADGWYAGRLGLTGDDCQYGDTLGLLAQIEIEYEDGTKEWIGTDEKFFYQESEYRYADLFLGEKIEEQYIDDGFYLPGYAGELYPAERSDEVFSNLRLQKDNQIRVVETFEAKAIWEEQSETGEDSLIIDLGQVYAGKFGVHFAGKKGREVVFECSEILDMDGRFAKNITEPYKDQTDIFLCSKDGDKYYEPMFTYHGLRYLRIQGLKREELYSIQGMAITSVMERTGDFSCSDERLNQLQKNIIRSQLSNMISVPTDCPQREKAGWTGDAQVFSATACFNENMKTFFDQWLEDMAEDQSPSGEIPVVIPYTRGYKRALPVVNTSAGWGDAAVIIPWTLYQVYGDPDLLRKHYPMMERWIEYVKREASEKNPQDLADCSEIRANYLKYIWNTGFHFGDWLTPSVSIDLVTGEVNMGQSAVRTKNIVPTLFFYYSSSLMVQVSHALGLAERERYYQDLANHIKEAFNYEYVDEQGKLKSTLQGVYVLALKFGILYPETKEKAAEELVRLIHENGNRLDTGFLSTPYILDVLMEIGQPELAYKLLLCKECPSWLYEVKQGATSIWESWQAILPDGRRSHISMNHYAMGCVGDWMYRNLAGIQIAEAGYKKIRIAPDLQAPLTWVKGKYKSEFGLIRCEWTKHGDKADILVEIPERAEVLIHLGQGQTVTAGPGIHHYKDIVYLRN